MTSPTRFLDSHLESLSPRTFAWRAPATIRAEAHDWLQLQLGRCADLQFADRFQRSCPVEGASPTDYLQRVVSLADGELFLAGIRFRGGDLTLPFVDLLATSWGPGRLQEVWSRVKREWKVFHPRSLRILSAAHSETPSLQARVDQVVLAGRVADLTQAPDGARALTLRTCTPAQAHRTVSLAFETLAPDLRALLHPADEETLAACQSRGMLRQLWIEGEPVGVIAVQRHAEFGLQGWLVIEEALVASHRGKGLAAPMQCALARELAARDPESALFGTIDRSNAASLAAARRAGRQEVMAYWFLWEPAGAEAP